MVFDCTFDLMNPDAGEEQYRAGAHPRRGVRQPRYRPQREARRGRRPTACSSAGRSPPASGGRHPLPSREKFAIWLSSVGFANNMQAVVYDRNGANYCGRLWWMLKWMGHEAVAVLDGGLQAWQAAGGEVDRSRRAFALPVELRRSAPLLALAGTTDVLARGSSNPARR